MSNVTALRAAGRSSVIVFMFLRGFGGRDPAAIRAEPVLRRELLGSGRTRVLLRARHGLPGLLASDRQCPPPGRARDGGAGFAQQVGMLPLTGTTDINHMKEDLASSTFDLSDDEVRLIESIGAA